MAGFARVYHPVLNSWQDVPEGDVQAWKDNGWLKTRPKHVDDSEAARPGEGYVPPTVAVEAAEDVSGGVPVLESPAAE